MRRWALILIVLMVACTQGGQSAVKSPVPSPIASPAQSPQSSPSPSPIPGDLPVNPVSFSCRLAIYQQTGYEGSPDFARQGLFISFPSDTTSIASGGKGGGYFDRAFNRWLLVTRESVSPDGTHYAYAGMQDNLLHVVNVADGKERTFSLNAIGANYVFDYAADGIYMTFGFEGLHGLWFVDANSGSSHQVPGISSPEASGGGGVIWAGEVNPADPQPINTGTSIGILPDQVTRVDVKTGSRTSWLYRPGLGVGVAALDIRGHPLISLVHNWRDTATTELLIAPDTTSQKTIYTGPLVGTLGVGTADSHGVWFGSAQGIYLYSESGGLQKVSNQPGFLANGCF